MGNCNCFKISNQQNALRNNDFLLEEGNINEGNNPNQNLHENEKNPYNNYQSTTNGVENKISLRGVNNPTQNEIKKRSNKQNKESDISNSNREKYIKEQSITKEKLEDTTDKDNNFDTFTSLNNNAFPQKDKNINIYNNINRDTNGTIIDKSNKKNVLNNQNKEELELKKNTIIKNQTLNKRLTEILKLKDLSKNLKEKKNSINVVFLGDKCVGKTSIVYQYIANKFDQYYIQTIIKEEFSKVINVNNKAYTINFTVTSGVREYQEDYTNLYKVSDFFIVCFDLTNKASFEKAQDIIKSEILPYVFLYNDGYANIVLLGNKSDLKEKSIDQQKVKEYCEKYNIDYYEISAKLKTNLNKVFDRIVDVYDEAMSSISNIA